tara:strand:+ start:3853 stop:4518 length:666 start_codon:yes stop_codon:yes gene_type:complete
MNVALVPARSGSKSIKNKNIKLFLKKPLIYWTLNSLEKSSIIDEIYLATDSKKIIDIAKNFNFKKLKFFIRSKSSSRDKSQTEEVLLEFLKKKKINKKNYIFLVQPTSPYIRSFDYKNAFKKLQKTKKQSLLSVIKSKNFFWTVDGKPINYSLDKRPRRQDNPGIYIENGAFYLNSVKNILRSKNRLTKPISIYEMPSKSLLELDENEDWPLAEYIKRNYF